MEEKIIESFSVLDIENLNIFIGDKCIVKGLSLFIEKGEVVALVGESGSGKSMTALSILRLYDNITIDGKIDFLGVNLESVGLSRLREIRGGEIGFIFQEPLTSLNPLHKIYYQIAEAITTHNNITKSELKKRVFNLLSLVELDKNLAYRYPYELSGGQRQRVVIAIAIANSPKLLIADEPTTALDVTIQAQIVKLLKKLQLELDISILFISHNLDVVKDISQRVYVIKNGEIVENSSTKELFLNPTHPYTKELLDYKKIREVNSQISSGEIVLNIKNLEVEFGKRRDLFFRKVEGFRALKEFSLKVFEGEILGVAGESGSGKSTLALAILRLIEIERGEIYFKDENLALLGSKRLREFRAKIQIVFQDPFSSLSPRMSIFDIVAEGVLESKKYSKDEIEILVSKTLNSVGLGKKPLYLYPHELSGGERQRVAIARALILNPELIIFDEPTSALDRSVQFQVISLLLELKERYNLTYIFITHDLKLLKELCDRVVILRDGVIVEEGSVFDVFKSPKMEYTKELLDAAYFKIADDG